MSEAARFSESKGYSDFLDRARLLESQLDVCRAKKAAILLNMNILAGRIQGVRDGFLEGNIGELEREMGGFSEIIQEIDASAKVTLKMIKNLRAVDAKFDEYISNNSERFPQA